MTLTDRNETPMTGFDEYADRFNNHPHQDLVGRVVRDLDDGEWFVFEVRTHRWDWKGRTMSADDALAIPLNEHRQPEHGDVTQLDILEDLQPVPFDEDPPWLRVLRVSMEMDMAAIRAE